MNPDKLARAVIDHYNANLPKKGKPSDKEWTSLASIVQTHLDPKTQELLYTVVSLGSGTKCLGQQELSPLGDIVSDSHAEVLARRGFLLYLHDQLFQMVSNKKSILTKTSSDARIQFSVAEHISFHMFISHLPCGDAAIIPAEDQEEPSPAKKSKLENADSPSVLVDTQFRSRTGAKLETGPLVYEDTQVVGKCRVKPGKGNPTLCMSCSDKIAKWQVLGLQGSLLGTIIPRPIRLASIVIGSGVPFSLESMNRALYSRFSNPVQTLKDTSDFLKNYTKPSISQASINFMDLSTSTKRNPCPSSISWHLNKTPGHSLAEFVQVLINGRKQGATVKNFGKPSSRVDVCRLNLFKSYVHISHALYDKEPFNDLTYREAKIRNTTYFHVWNKLRGNSVLAGWTLKPSHLMNFKVSDT